MTATPSSNTPPIVRCPTCGKSVPWAETQRYRPFCSERCRLIDLGEWADGSYAIPAEFADLPHEPDVTAHDA